MTDPRARLAELEQEVAAEPGGARFPDLADALIQMGRYADAVATCERGLAVEQRPEGLRALGEAQLLLGQPEQAIDSVEQALAARQEDPHCLRLLAECHLALGRPDLALPILERSARLDPSDMRTLDLLVQAQTGQAGAPSGGAPAAPAALDLGLDDDAGGLDLGEGQASWFEGNAAGAAPAPTAPTAAPAPTATPAPTAAAAAPTAAAAAPTPTGPAPTPTGPAPTPTAPAPTPAAPVGGPGPGPGGQPWSFAGNDVLVDGSRAASAPVPTAPTIAPPASADAGAGAPNAGDGDALELDLGPPPEPPSPASALPAAGSPARGPLPAARGPLPTGRGPLPSPGPSPSRGGRVGPGNATERAAAELGARRRRQLLMAGGLVVGVVVLVLVGVGIRHAVRGRHENAALAAARAAYAEHTYAGYRATQKAAAKALAIDSAAPEALGLDAFASARLFADFGSGTPALVRAQERLTDAERLPEVPPRAAAARALIDLTAGKPGNVVLETAKAIAAHPESAELVWVKARAEYDLQRPDLAISTLRTLTKTRTAFLPAPVSLARLLVRAGKGKEAATVEETVLAAHPRYVPALVELLQSAVSGHVPAAKALAALDRVRHDLVTIASPAEICRLHLSEARLSIAAGRPADATVAEDAARTGVADGACKADLGRELMMRHRPDAAAEQLSQAANALEGTHASEAARLKLEAARAAVAAGHTAQAISLLADVAAGPSSAAVRARAQLLDGNLDAAQVALAPELRHRHPRAEILEVATGLALARGHERKARGYARRAARHARRRSDRIAAARALIAVGEGRKAVRLLGRILRHDHQPGYDLLTLAGRAEATSGRKNAGLSELERAIALNPDAAAAVDAYVSLAPPDRVQRFLTGISPPQGPALAAYAALSIGDTKTARAELAAAKKAGADGPRVTVVAARLALERGDASALGRLESAAQAHPDDALVQGALAAAYLELGRIGDAASAYQKALRRDPGLLSARVGLAQADALGASSDPGAAMTATRATVDWVERRGAHGPLAGRAEGALAIACATASQTRCAKQALAKAHREAPRDARVLIAAGRALEQLGDDRGAAKSYRAAAARPGGAEGLLGVGLLAAAGHGPRAAGARALERFLEEMPGHARVAEAKAALQRLK